MSRHSDSKFQRFASNGISRRDFLAACGLGSVALGLAACGSSSGSDDSSSSGSSSDSSTSSGDYTLVEDGKLTLISNFYFPPFVFMSSDSSSDDTTTYQGFDVDLYKAIADKLGLEYNILPTVQFDTIVPTIKQGGKADISLGAITITDERKKEIDFSDPYLDSNQSIVVLSGGDYDVSDDKSDTEAVTSALNVSDAQIAVQSGTTGESWAKENLTSATIVPLDDVIECFTGVQTGLYSAAVCDLPVSEYEISTGYDTLKVALEIPTGEQYGAVLSKDNPNLTEAVNEALAEIKSDGTMDDLQTKWFGEVISD